MKLTDLIDKPPPEVAEALTEIQNFTENICLFESEIQRAVEARDTKGLIAIDRAYTDIRGRICAGYLRTFSEWEGLPITVEVAVKMSPMLYALFHFVPDIAINHRLRLKIEASLRQGTGDAIHCESYRELWKLITQKMAEPKPWGSSEMVLGPYENLLPKARNICKGGTGLAREEAVKRAFPELRGRPLVSKSGRGIEPAWVVYNVMAAQGGTNANAVHRMVIAARKQRDALTAIETSS